MQALDNIQVVPGPFMLEWYDQIKANLIRGREVLIRKGWTRHHLAQDKAGESCALGSQGACAYCSLGCLVYVCCGEDEVNDCCRVLQEVIFRQYPELHDQFQDCRDAVVIWNDQVARDKDEVLQAWDMAIDSLNFPEGETK